jgi:hypothetical protein
MLKKKAVPSRAALNVARRRRAFGGIVETVSEGVEGLADLDAQ